MVVTNVLGQPQVVELRGATVRARPNLRLPFGLPPPHLGRPGAPFPAPLSLPQPPPPASRSPSAPHLGLPGELVGLDENGAYAHIFAHGPQSRLHGLPRTQDGHASDLGARRWGGGG